MFGTTLCAVLLMAAGGQSAFAKRPIAVKHEIVENDLPIPPIPPDGHPFSVPAPIPDVSMEGPVAAVNTEPSVGLKFYRAPVYAPGMAFAPGSQFQTSEDKKPIQTPGFSVSVPLK